jgi:hypothetical protein
MPEVQEGWARNEELQTETGNRAAWATRGRYTLRRLHKGRYKGISHQIDYRGRSEIYVLCNEQRKGLDNALVDTGSQVSLVKESGLIRGSNTRIEISRIQGITDDFMEIKRDYIMYRGYISTRLFSERYITHEL